MAALAVVRTRTFISYSHTDHKHLVQLKLHLVPFVREERINVWDDTMIKPGALWRVEIEQAIASAKIAILLVSASFLASKFIAEKELPPLLTAAKQEEAAIISVILSPSAFKHTELVQYQTANPPEKPLAGMNYNSRQAVWAWVAEQVNDALNS
jgi:internalin A